MLLVLYLESQSVDMSLSKSQKMVKHREAWHTAVHGVRESDTTEQLNKWNHITKPRVKQVFFHKSFITLYFIFKRMSCFELNFWIKGEVYIKAYLFIHLFT